MVMTMEQQKVCRCEPCNRSFATPEAKHRHKMDKHQPHRRFDADVRPDQRGPIKCGYPRCRASFGNEWNATQHRRDVHGEAVALTQADRD
jgi:hypothetical protein